MVDIQNSQFQSLFDQLSLNKDHLGEEYLEKLTLFLQKKESSKSEIYKYSLFFLITNRKKITDILQINKDTNIRLKNLLNNFIEDREIYKPVNELVKTIFPDAFKSCNEKIINLIENERKDKPDENCLKKDKPDENCYKKDKPDENCYKKDKPDENCYKNFLISNVNRAQTQLIENENLNKENEKIVQDQIHNIKVSYEQNKINTQNNNEFLVKETKAVEDIKNKIDNILNFASEKKYIYEFVGWYFIKKGLDLFGGNGFFLDTSPIKLKLLSDEYKMKMLTIYSKLFFLFTEKQKQAIKKKFKSEILCDDFLDENSINIFTNLLCYSNTSKSIAELNIEKDYIQKSFKRFHEDSSDLRSEDILKLMENVKMIDDIKDLFYLLVLNKVHHILEEDTYWKLLCLLYIHLTKNEFFQRENCYEFSYQLYIIKLFYGDEESLGKNLLIKDGNTREIVYKQINLSKIRSQMVIDYSMLFSDGEINFCDKVIAKIKRFFVFGDKFNLKDLLDSKNNNFRFTMGIVELTYKKDKIISIKDISKYRNNLQKIEECLYGTYEKHLRTDRRGGVNNAEYQTQMYEDKQKTFEKIEMFIKNCLNRLHRSSNVSVTIYPFGSITQFLGNRDSDLDIYMQIQGEKTQKLYFLEQLFEAVRKTYINWSKVCTKRLLTISFTSHEGVKIDLNYFGVCSVLNSAILRVYSQCDERFVILAHNIKHVIKDLKINNTDESKIYLNSFSWMMLLVTFLQDVVYPPVLPKILSNCNKTTRKIESANMEKKIREENYKNKYKYQNKKDFGDIISNTWYKEFEINEEFHTSEKISEIVVNFQLSMTQRNMMSLAELFLKFLEFVIFYLKYDSVFVHCSFAGECFMSKNDIKKMETQDRLFYENSKYLIKKDHHEKGDFLIREPFDHGYNAGQTMYGDRTKEFIEELKIYYFKLLEKGEVLIKNIK